MGGLEGKGEELKGDIKARVGDATNNPDMEAEGRRSGVGQGQAGRRGRQGQRARS